jgi:hypothetical protein
MARKNLNTLSNILFKLRQNGCRFFVYAIVLIASVMRIQLYGDPKLSVAGNDTLSYVESSRVPFFSSEMMTGRRLLTTNLLYKFFEPKDDYQILANGSIATTKRVVQPGFTNIVIVQLIVSIVGWGLLALSVSENIKNPLIKILSAALIVLFAFTPQIADWDSILMTESFTFSLFALQLAILIKMTFLIYNESNFNVSIYTVLWIIIYFLWTFLKDTNLFASFITIGMIAVLLFSIRYRKNKYIHSILVSVTLILVLGLTTSSNSTRSLVQLVNIYNDDLLRNPASVSTLKELGMPTPNSADYQSWFQKDATNTLIKFMFIHPGYPSIKIIRDFPGAFTEIKQTYFKAPEQAKTRELLLTLGNAFHPENTTPFLLSLLLVFGITLLGIKNTNEVSRPWAWLGVWLFLTASITLIPTILGDTWALNRHALLSTMIYRLFMWIFSIVIMDVAIEQNTQKTAINKKDLLAVLK